MAACDCIHDAGNPLVSEFGPVHDPRTGACLVVNPRLGPCPCAATPAPVMDALERAWNYTRKGATDGR